MIVDEWLNAEYEGGRHQVRIDMIKDIEEKQNRSNLLFINGRLLM